MGSGLLGFKNLGQNTETLKLAKVGLAKVGQAHNWPKSVKELAKVGLAKVGLAKVGHDRPSAFHTAVLAAARCDKEWKYRELLVSEWCQLVVVAMETGGRWSNEATEFISSLAEAKAWEAAPIFRGSAFFGWRKRWTRMLAVSCGRAFASSLVSPRSAGLDGQDGHPPDFAELFASG